jgi:Clp amino terminal domain, pathogenicity island component
MSPSPSVDLRELIAEVERAVPGDAAVERVIKAQNLAYLLADTGEQLVGHFVSAAKAAGASWAAIGDALGVSRQAAQQSRRGLFSRFTDRARHVVVLAQEAARHHRNHHIGTEHLLLGLLRESQGLGSELIVRHAGSADVANIVIHGKLPPTEDGAPPAKPPFTQPVKTALEHASRAAADLDHGFVGTEHILLGLLHTGGPAAEALAELGLDLTTVEQEVRDEIARRLAAS